MFKRQRSIYGTRIRYCIYNIDKEYFEDAWEINGGISIENDGIILTGRINDSNDDGFRGDYVFYNLFDMLLSIPQLLYGRWCRIDFIEGPEAFKFLPDGKIIRFKYFIEGMGTIVDKENIRYSGYHDGNSIPLEELVSEIIHVCKEFLEYVEDKIKRKDDVIDFKKEIILAEKAYQEYLLRNEQYKSNS